MPFDQSTILDLELSERNAELFASWTSTAPAGTVFQVYVDGDHAWSGTARSVALPHPSGTVAVDVGTVTPAESSLDLGSQLPTPPGGGSRVRLTWSGGTWETPPGSPPITGFHVYLGDAPGAAVDYVTPVATVSAYTQGAITDGFGLGPFGAGGFGMSAGTYVWTSGRLAAGTWHAAVAPFDAAGNEGTPVGATQVIAGPPGPVPRDAAGKRVAYQFKYGASTPVGFGEGGFGDAGFGEGSADGAPYVTLSWRAAPPA